jgi:hypothetical protein
MEDTATWSQTGDQIEQDDVDRSGVSIIKWVYVNR